LAVAAGRAEGAISSSVDGGVESDEDSLSLIAKRGSKEKEFAAQSRGVGKEARGWEVVGGWRVWGCCACKT